MRESGLTDLLDADSRYGIGPLGTFGRLDGLNFNTLFPPVKTFFFQMYGLSNIFLVSMLLATKRHIDNGRLNWKDEDFLTSFAAELELFFSAISATYSERDLEKFRHFASNSGIKWKRMARQIAFWCDTSDNGYRSVMNEFGTIPKGIYERRADVSTFQYPIPNYNPLRGFETNGEPDIGAYNGPLGLTEFEKAAQLLFLPISLAESDARKAQTNSH